MESKPLGRGVSVVLTVLIISSALMICPGLGQAPPKSKSNNSTKTTPDDVYFQTLPLQLKDFVKSCIKKISLECGEEIIGYMLKKTNVSAVCCHYLVEMGFECHSTMTNVFAGSPSAEGISCHLIKNSREVFDHCVTAEKKKDGGNGHRPNILP